MAKYNEDTGCTCMIAALHSCAEDAHARQITGLLTVLLRPISQIKHTADAIAGLRLGPRNDDDVTTDRGAQKTALDLLYRVFTNELSFYFIITQTTTN